QPLTTSPLVGEVADERSESAGGCSNLLKGCPPPAERRLCETTFVDLPHKGGGVRGLQGVSLLSRQSVNENDTNGVRRDGGRCVRRGVRAGRTRHGRRARSPR